jgi:hypothetical protein
VFLDRGLPRRKITVCCGLPQSGVLNLKADGNRPGLAAPHPCCLWAVLGNPQCTWELFVKGLFLLWQSALLERGVANRVKSSTRYTYITLQVWNILADGLFRPQLSTNGLSWQLDPRSRDTVPLKTFSRRSTISVVGKQYVKQGCHTSGQNEFNGFLCCCSFCLITGDGLATLLQWDFWSSRSSTSCTKVFI